MAANVSLMRPLALVGAKLTTRIVRNIRRRTAEAALTPAAKSRRRSSSDCGAMRLLNSAANENLGACDDGLDKNENLQFHTRKW